MVDALGKFQASWVLSKLPEHPKLYIRTAKSMDQFQRHNQLIVEEKFASYAPVSAKPEGGGVGFITNLIHSK